MRLARCGAKLMYARAGTGPVPATRFEGPASLGRGQLVVAVLVRHFGMAAGTSDVADSRHGLLDSGHAGADLALF